ncbi:MAG: glycoside hydrolase family 113 [Streptosporangiaceae bacterium]
MKILRVPRQLLAVALLGSAVAGCVAAPAPAKPAALVYRTVPAPAVQLGIDIDFYTYPGQDVAAAASADVAYVKSLHANSISVSFPFFTPGPGSSTVEGTNATPPPAELALVASTAERAGLYVSIRPLLDQSSSSIGISRTTWKPADPAAWFASYRKFLLPYVAMAQRARVPEFIDGAEFTAFGGSRFWNGLVTALRAVYHGTVVYANNWGIPLAGNGGAGVRESVDSYHPLQLPVHASLARVTAGWRAYDRTLPAGTVETEIGIAAVPGAYALPYQNYWKGAPLVPEIQTRWFTAACNAAASERIGGLYFWSLGFGQALHSPPTAAAPTSWVAGPGARAISSCFQRLGS